MKNKTKSKIDNALKDLLYKLSSITQVNAGLVANKCSIEDLSDQIKIISKAHEKYSRIIRAESYKSIGVSEK